MCWNIRFMWLVNQKGSKWQWSVSRSCQTFICRVWEENNKPYVGQLVPHLWGEKHSPTAAHASHRSQLKSFLGAWGIAGPPCLECYVYGGLALHTGGWAIGWQPTTIEKLTVRKPKAWLQNWGIKINENWIKQCSKELIQLFGDLDVLPFVRTSQLNWIGHINKMDPKRKVSQVFNNNLQWSWLRGWPKTDGGIVYIWRWINAKL